MYVSTSDIGPVSAARINGIERYLIGFKILANSPIPDPASDLMSAFHMSTFQQQAGFVIVLPGPTDS